MHYTWRSLQLVCKGNPTRASFSLLQCRGTWSLPKSSSCFIKTSYSSPAQQSSAKARKVAMKVETKSSLEQPKAGRCQAVNGKTPLFSLGLNEGFNYFS